MASPRPVSIQPRIHPVQRLTMRNEPAIPLIPGFARQYPDPSIFCTNLGDRHPSWSLTHLSPLLSLGPPLLNWLSLWTPLP